MSEIFKSGCRGGLFELRETTAYIGPEVVERKVSVVLPLGSTAYIPKLRKCLRSIRWQDHVDHDSIEVILAYVHNEDEEDKPRLYSLASEFAAHVVESKKEYDHFPLCLARNIGARSAKHETLIFVDSDAILDPEFIARALIQRWGLVTCWFSYLKEDSSPDIGKYDVRARALSGEVRKTAYGGGIITPRNTFIEIGGFDEVYDKAWGGDDNDMVDRLLLYGLPWYNLSEEESIVNIHQYHPVLVDKSSPEVQANRDRYKALNTIVRNEGVEWGKP